jgi:hypothetical protein
MDENTNLDIQIWEAYRIKERMPIIILEYAKWSEETRIKIFEKVKCRRRRDLKVSKANCLCHTKIMNN